ncbi:MAG: DMT family transporter [Oscillospiraceae bacterium]|nr:DMT family transporter [Oscillospiraceae bacterium]
MNIKLSKCSAAWLLAAVIIARSSSYLFSKLLLGSMSLFTLLSVRFTVSFIILIIIFRKSFHGLDAADLFRGVIIGLLFTAVMTFDMTALSHCSSSTVSFLVNSAVVIVPIINAAYTKVLPGRRTVLGSLTALAGVAVLTLSQVGHSTFTGVIYGLLAAGFYSATIFVTGLFSRRSDPVVLGVIQVGVIGVCSLMISLLSGNLTLSLSPVSWVYILFLALICTCFGFTLQPVCQKYVDTDTAGMLCAINPMSTTLLGVLFLNESVNKVMLCGCALIILGILIPQSRFLGHSTCNKRQVKGP